MKVYKRLYDYFSKHFWYAKLVFLSAGTGIGILIARPFASEHPVRWALAFLCIAVLGHIYPLFLKKK